MFAQIFSSNRNSVIGSFTFMITLQSVFKKLGKIAFQILITSFIEQENLTCPLLLFLLKLIYFYNCLGNTSKQFNPFD